MRIILLLALLAAAAAVPVAKDLEGQFLEYVSKFNKRYNSMEEWEHRFVVWKDNLVKVTKHNLEAAKGLHSFTVGMNHLADMTNEEYRQRMLRLRPSKSSRAAVHTPVGSIPTSWDWRTQKNIVNPVKDQGQCGSCWAFSAVATMEGACNLKSGKLNSLSEQELVDCVNGGKDDCDSGGEMFQGIEYAISAGGMDTEASYPYTATSGHACRFKKSAVACTFSSYANISSGDETALTNAAYTQPIISVGIDASSWSFQMYSGGVYDESACSSVELDHGVAVVGYGVSGKKDYYIVRNSWGDSWGLEGYIWMSRNKKNQCGIATQACYALV